MHKIVIVETATEHKDDIQRVSKCKFSLWSVDFSAKNEDYILA